jgi:type I restriction enzyme R subunit
MLEELRLRLRGLVPFIQRAKQKLLYTDFTDTLGPVVEVDLTGLVDTFEKFRRKARHFLLTHLDQVAVGKLHSNQPINVADLAELRAVLVAAGLGTARDLDRAEAEAGGFGLFVRGLVGLDRTAAKSALSEFLDDRSFSADQIEFAGMVVDHLVDHGLIEVARFYESPFTDVTPTGPDALLGQAFGRLLDTVATIRRNAEAA